MSTKGRTTGQPAVKKAVKKATKSKPGPAQNTSLKKQYMKSTPVCKVTFRLPKDAAPDANTVSVVGEFNDWNMSEHRMKKLKNGDFTATVELPCNREFRFRYLIDSCRWENDWFADKYVPNEHGSDDSVVVV
ncbi:MAG: isoamylase early set domain-containing protein [Nitrospirae bacterium]|nr:isoamylase early set domain-containing protein [Nitrospirota bacterium]